MIDMKIDKYEKIGVGKYRIYLSNGEVIEIYDDVIIDNDLLLKGELDRNTYNKIIRESELQEKYNSCVKYISVRIRCTKEIYDYLLKKKVSGDDIDLIIDKLHKNKLLDDNYFCECFIKDKLRFTSWGPYRIVRELNKYSIDNNVINNYSYLMNDEVVYDKLYKLISKAIKSNHKLDNNKLRNKIYRNYLNMGFKSDMIVNILNQEL
ncbi:MAG: RecX family transcriptional regulator [Bacilli bacterium]|nr:RecX family transcriptional regulator [Bacilli bacterium]